MTLTLARFLAPLELANEPDANGGEQKPNQNVVKRAEARYDGESEGGCNHGSRRIA